MNLVILDLDGVLLDSIDAKLTSFRKTFEKFGIKNFPSDKELTAVTRPSDAFKKMKSEMNGISSYYSMVYDQELKSANLFLSLSKLKAFKSQNIRFALFTSQPRVRVTKLLSKQDLSLFDIMLFEEELGGRTKSESNGLAKILDYIRPDCSCFIGDTVDDICTAKKNNIIAIFASWGYTENINALGIVPDMVLYYPTEIIDLLENLKNGNRNLCSN